MVCPRLVAAVLMGALTLGGCTSMKPIRPAAMGEPPFGPVAVGDILVVQSRDGARARIVVKRIEGETLVADDGRRYGRWELLSIEREGLSGPKTVGLILGIAGGIALGLMIAVATWLGENSR